MIYIAALGAALLAYVVYLISGVGVAITAFIGIILIVAAIWYWFYETNKNLRVIHAAIYKAAKLPRNHE
jgi:hypothetical protein